MKFRCPVKLGLFGKVVIAILAGAVLVAACRDAWGHDLLADGQGGYYFTNHSGVWRFDPATS